MTETISPSPQTDSSTTTATVPESETTEAAVTPGVQAVAADAAAAVAGVHQVGSEAGRAAVRAMGRIRGSRTVYGAGVSAEIGEKQTAIDISLSVEYGSKIADVSAKVREDVIAAVKASTGLDVVEVNVNVTSLHHPDDDVERITAEDAVDNVADAVDGAADAVSAKANDVSRKASELSDKAADLSDQAADKAVELSDQAADKASEVSDRASAKASELSDKASAKATEVSDKAAELSIDASDKAAELADKASDLAAENTSGKVLDLDAQPAEPEPAGTTDVSIDVKLDTDGADAHAPATSEAAPAGGTKVIVADQVVVTDHVVVVPDGDSVEIKSGDDVKSADSHADSADSPRSDRTQDQL